MPRWVCALSGAPSFSHALTGAALGAITAAGPALAAGAPAEERWWPLGARRPLGAIGAADLIAVSQADLEAALLAEIFALPVAVRVALAPQERLGVGAVLVVLDHPGSLVVGTLDAGGWGWGSAVSYRDAEFHRGGEGEDARSIRLRRHYEVFPGSDCTIGTEEVSGAARKLEIGRSSHGHGCPLQEPRSPGGGRGAARDLDGSVKGAHGGPSGRVRIGNDANCLDGNVGISKRLRWFDAFGDGHISNSGNECPRAVDIDQRGDSRVVEERHLATEVWLGGRRAGPLWAWAWGGALGHSRCGENEQRADAGA